jgi:hypothetical protein
MDKSGAGAGFLRELWFPLPIYIPSACPQSSSLSPEAGTIGQEWSQSLTNQIIIKKDDPLTFVVSSHLDACVSERSKSRGNDTAPVSL